MKTALQSIVLILTITTALSAESPKQLNQEGLDLYRSGNYGQAAAKFRKAVEINPRYGWAWYNLACTLGVIRKKGNICEHDAYKDRIVNYLTKAVKYQPLIKSKFQNDPDLEPVRDTIGYQKLIGLTLKNSTHLKLILQRVTTWYGPAPGAYGHTSAFSFNKNGNVSFWYLSMTPDGNVKQITIRGSWHLNKKTILVKFNNPYNTKKYFRGHFDQQSRLVFDGLTGFYLDTPDECSA